ncbi:MAG TPA: DUF371 domain-containing protein [Candidatus Methanofastidiosa archaeon]|nr:DUF371 domain-containing protein [Candidatus Methanofastidiosa archaeon]HPR41037.1 DUF371 domain-containing protein [Candidatus Methanofastidiosa archaeon]
MRFVITAWGHSNITARHKTTLEITKDGDLGQEGDCIVAVGADTSLSELDERQREELRRSETRATFRCAGHVWSVNGRGSLGLAMSDPREMVIRKSGFESDRTLMVFADKASCDIPREMVKCLKDPCNKIEIVIETLGRPDSKNSHQSNRT